MSFGIEFAPFTINKNASEISQAKRQEVRRLAEETGLEIVGINYERGPESEWKNKIDSFVADNSDTYPCVIGDEATRSMVPSFRGHPNGNCGDH